MSRGFNDINILRRLAAILTVGIVGATNLFDMYMCASSFTTPFTNTTTIVRNTSHTIPFITSHLTHANRTLNDGHFASVVCTLFPSYYSNYAILILIATSMVSQLTHICKFCLMVVLAGMISIWYAAKLSLPIYFILLFRRLPLLHEYFPVEKPFQNGGRCLRTQWVSVK